MAKRKPALTLMEMERKLGYSIDSINYPAEAVKRFYSNLTPVANNVYERIKKEFEEHERQKSHKEYEIASEHSLPELGAQQIIAHGQDTVKFTRLTRDGFYSVGVDIHYGFGLDLPLLFTRNEACRAMTTAKLQPNTPCGLGLIFSKLPKELRDKIYIYALPEYECKVGDSDSSSELNFVGGIGDPSGFYFPLNSFTVLRLNRQIRQEALPLAYRRTVFRLDDMDDLIKLLIAVGDIGRSNIESLEFAWQSRADSEYQWAKMQVPSEHSLSLPTLHVAKCVQLLKECKSLRFLRLYFESDLVLGMSPDAYKADPGICELCSVRGIERVEIWDLGHEPIEQCGFVKWLKEAIESFGEDRRN